MFPIHCWLNLLHFAQVRLRMENDYPGNTPPQTVPNMIRASVQQYPGTIAVGYKEHEGGTYTESGISMLNWDSRYLCHFSTKMAEIWSPGTSFLKDVWTCKISVLYLLYFHSCESFCGLFSDFH